MFDYVRSSYPLGEHFSGQCHTKDIECGIGGTMAQYWISPDGHLYLVDYSHTADFVEIKEGEEGYEKRLAFFNFKWIPNGVHGKVKPHLITNYVTIYPENWKGDWNDWPECRINFKYGVLQDFEILTKGKKYETG